MSDNYSTAQAVEFLKKLIEIPSLSSEEQEAATFLESALPPLINGTLTRDDNSIILTLGRPNAAHKLLLCSHIDTVNPSERWTYPPFKATQVDNRIYGLGANDALASVVSMIFAAARTQDVIAGNAGLVLALVAEEEKGDKGFCRIEPSLDYTDAIFGEPTNLRIGTAMRGYMRVNINAEGKACHASRPWEGQNAIKELAQIITQISAFELKDDSPWGQATVEPTIISGGTTINQIPDTAQVVLDIRPTSAVNNERIIEMIEGLNCPFEVLHDRRRPLSCSEDTNIFKAIKHAHPNAITYAFGGTCDMAFATKPAVVAGPGQSERSHAADEFIKVNEMDAGIAFYEEIIRSYVKLYQ